MNKKAVFSVVVLAIICIVCSVFIIFMKNANDKAVEAIIYVDNKVYTKINLENESDTEFVVETEYGMNKITVYEGRICVSDSDCPDKICVKTGYTDNCYKPIICMPHRLEIVVTGSETDGVAR